ncbi:MAG: transglycosylase SLT domain-containing protein [Rhodospirillales bacterium]
MAWGFRPNRMVSAAVAAGVLLVHTPVSADTGGAAGAAFDRAWSLCAEATGQVERERGIPRHLLTAISLAESGRWDGVNGATHAWPWTVTSGEQTWKLDSKAEAIARVDALRGAGTTNIDVGCMQINMRYHPDAFTSLDAAFDPLTNARYAGQFLSDLYETSRNWLTAAGNYHSNTEEFHNRYKLKVARFWNDSRNDDAAIASGAGRIAATPSTAAIDYQRTAQLNHAFQARRAAQAQAGASTAAAGAITPLVGDRYALNAQIQRVRKQAERKREVRNLVQSERVPQAAPEVNPDLQLWRNLYRSGPTSGGILSGLN